MVLEDAQDVFHALSQRVPPLTRRPTPQAPHPTAMQAWTAAAMGADANTAELDLRRGGRSVLPAVGDGPPLSRGAVFRGR